MVDSITAMQNYIQQQGDQKIGASGFQTLKGIALEDHHVNKEEARFLMDQMLANKFEESTVPAVKELLSSQFENEEKQIPAYIGRNKLEHVKAVADGLDIKQAQNITDENKIDEVYFKDEAGKLYVAYGSPENQGAMDLNGLKEGYLGRYGDKKITVIHINNETNTAWEGAKSPWVSTYKTVKEASQTGIVKGLADAGGVIAGLVIGKSMIENGIKATEQAKVAAETVKAAAKVAETAKNTAEAAKAVNAAAKAVGALDKAKAFGETIGETVSGTLKKIAIGVAVVGAVAGTVAAIGSAVGAIRGSRPDTDFTTIDMVSDQKLNFMTEK